eukprot:jgi/Chlat1/8601/Chrsp86S07997
MGEMCSKPATVDPVYHSSSEETAWRKSDLAPKGELSFAKVQVSTSPAADMAGPSSVGLQSDAAATVVQWRLMYAMSELAALDVSHVVCSDVFKLDGVQWRMYLVFSDKNADQISVALQLANARDLPPGVTLHKRFLVSINNDVSPTHSFLIGASHKFTSVRHTYTSPCVITRTELLREGFVRNDSLMVELQLHSEGPVHALFTGGSEGLALAPATSGSSNSGPHVQGVPMPICSTSGIAETVSMHPHIVVIHHFLTDEECQHLVNLATPFLKPSLVSGHRPSKNRTSWGMFMTAAHYCDSVVRVVEDKIATTSRALGFNLSIDKSDKLQVIRYYPGQEFKPHYDNDVGDVDQRACTMLLFLNDVEEGGETFFPKGIPLHSDKETGIAGKALMFWSRMPDGNEDSRSLHGGRAVVKGEKWLASKWLAQQR